ncbi:MAG: tetratricopeptide repeat protein, partial [Candidatus Cloacimonadaceae bacterium]
VAKALKRLNSSGKEEYSVLHNKLKPHGVQDFSAISGFGDDIYILDSRACKVHIFNAETGDYKGSMGGKGKQENTFSKAVSMAVDSEGMIHVLDSEQKKIARFKKSEGYGGVLNYNFVRNVSLANLKVKPMLLRIKEDMLYCLLADGSIISIDKTSEKQTVMNLGNVKAKSFDFIYEGDLAVVDNLTQKLRIYTAPKYGRKAEYFGIRSGAAFPHFAQIQNIRYDVPNSRLAIMDSQAEGLRFLNFYASLGDAPLPRMSLDAQGNILLKWDTDSGINSWVIRKINNKDAVQEHISVPEYICQTPSPKLYSYSVRAIAADQKQSSESGMLTDYYSYANYLRQEKRYRDAIQAYERAQVILQDDRVKEQIVTTYSEMADSYSAIGDYDHAHEALDEALKLTQYISLIDKKCELYSIEKKYQRAIELLMRVTPSYQDYEPLTWRFIQLSYLAENYDDVIRVAKIYRKKYEDKLELYEYEAESYKKRGEIEAAIDVYITINTKQPSFETELEIAGLSIELDSFHEAQQRLSLLRQKYPGKPMAEVSYLLGRCQLGLEIFGRAQEYFGEAIAGDNKNPVYYHYLGLAYQQPGMLEEAKTNFKRAYELAPQNVEYAFAYAKLLHEELSTDAALKVMRAINEYIGTNAAAADYHLLYAKILRDLKQYKEAMAEISKARNYRPDSFEINKLYTDIETDYRIDQGNLPPLQLQDLRVDKIYPALNSFYQKNPIGTVVLKNNRDNAIENITLNVQITGVGVEKEFVERIVPANSEKKVYLRADFLDEVFNLSGPKEIRVSAKYFYMGAEESAPLPAKNIEILPRGAMDWSNRSSLACFINPSEHYIGHFVQTNILPVFGSDSGSVQHKNKNILNAIKVYSFYSANGFQYVSDPSTSNQRHSELDNVRFPTETISAKSGDCEDFLVLLAASLESIGISTALIDLPASGENSGHVMLAIDSQMNAGEIRNSGLDTDAFIMYKNSYWLPLETTFMGKEGFIQAWLYAKKLYEDSQSSTAPATLISFSDAHESYPPSSYSRVYTGWDQSKVKGSDVQKVYNSEVSKLSNMSLENKLLEYLNTLDRYPDNINYRLKYARELWMLNKKTEAENQYLQVIAREPNNFTANLHLGNICAEASRTEDARYYYNKALAKADDRQKDQIYCNLCILEYQNQDKQRALEYFNLLSDKRILQERERSIYLDLSHN